MYTHAVANTQALEQLVYEIRDPQTNSVHFRDVLEKIGEYLALDVLKELSTVEKSIRTETGAVAQHKLVNEIPVLVTILRAGMPLNIGVHKVFVNSEVGFLAMSRDEKTLLAKVEYIALPEIKDRIVIVVDTMLATGGSLIDAIQIVEKSAPKQIIVLTAIASQPGIDRVKSVYPLVKIFSTAIDPSLNEKGYIIPGLGDAGDRAYGYKVIIKYIH
jgi:uracil phosphoribosyltransferase